MKYFRAFYSVALALILSGCVAHFSEPPLAPNSRANLVCESAKQWQGQVIGDGHCVSLIKHCSNAPRTALWRPSTLVKGNNIKPGTIIATFKGQVYPSRSGYHAAIYISQDSQGIWVWDQWQGKPVHRRLIRWNNKRGTEANKGSAYRVVRISETQ